MTNTAIIASLLTLIVGWPTVASATPVWQPKVKGTAVCVTDGQTTEYSVTWTVTNTHPSRPMRIVHSSRPLHQTLAATTVGRIAQIVKVRWRWPGHVRSGSGFAHVNLDGQCTVGTASNYATYTVLGVGSADVTYDLANGISQASGASLPWSIQVPVVEANQFYEVSAQDDTGAQSAHLTCEITLNGQVVSTSQATGAYAICDADYPIT